MARARSITADAVFGAICTLRDANGFSPTLRELAALCGLVSAHNLYPYLEELRDAGRIAWTPGVARTIRVLNADDCGGG